MTLELDSAAKKPSRAAGTPTNVAIVPLKKSGGVMIRAVKPTSADNAAIEGQVFYLTKEGQQSLTVPPSSGKKRRSFWPW